MSKRGERTGLRSLRRHRVPAWWADAKLGIFVHWTPASVAGFAPADAEPTELVRRGHPHAIGFNPYTEWYENSLRFDDTPVAAYHREHFGDRPYAEFADGFRAGLEHWDPAEWADRFARAGARYVVLVTKHHDGFCLWPSEVRNPNVSGWNTGRDVVGELADAVRARGLRFGVYYSGGLDWTFEPRPIGTPADLLLAVPAGEAYADYADAQVRELIERYHPSLLWNDIAWPFGGARLWQLFADYYAAVPDGVVNDRWMPRTAAWSLLEPKVAQSVVNRIAARTVRDGLTPPKPPHFDYRTPEYTSFDHVPPTAWECCRGIDRSFGYNRTSPADHFLSRDELLGSFVDIVSKGGNLLLNVGPRGEDATIPDEQTLRLDWLAEWMEGAEPAIRSTRPWVVPGATSDEGHQLRFTALGDDVHVVVLDGPAGRVGVRELEPSVTGRVETLAGEELAWDPRPGGGLSVDLAALGAPGRWPVAFRVVRADARP